MYQTRLQLFRDGSKRHQTSHTRPASSHLGTTLTQLQTAIKAHSTQAALKNTQHTTSQSLQKACKGQCYIYRDELVVQYKTARTPFEMVCDGYGQQHTIHTAV